MARHHDGNGLRERLTDGVGAGIEQGPAGTRPVRLSCPAATRGGRGRPSDAASARPRAGVRSSGDSGGAGRRMAQRAGRVLSPCSLGRRAGPSTGTGRRFRPDRSRELYGAWDGLLTQQPAPLCSRRSARPAQLTECRPRLPSAPTPGCLRHRRANPCITGRARAGRTSRPEPRRVPDVSRYHWLRTSTATLRE